jgi:hypothetical protein
MALKKLSCLVYNQSLLRYLCMCMYVYVVHQLGLCALQLAAAPITGGFVDPFTGGNRLTTTQPPATPAQPVFLVFDNVPPIDKLAAKV